MAELARTGNSRRARGRPRLLDAAEVASAGLRVLDRDGLDGLTMATVADELGVSVATPYSYYPSKSALLNAIADLVIGGVAEPGSAAGLDRVQEFVRSLHLALLAHPAVPEMLASRTVTGVGAARSQEILLAALDEAGLDASECVIAYRLLLSYLTGFTQRRIAFERDPAAESARRQELEVLSRDRFPTLHRLLPQLDAQMSMAEFDLGLDQLLERYRR